MSRKYFLALTADQRFWDTSRPILFLGEWCKIYSEREKWQALDSETMPYHWLDRDLLDKDFAYLDKAYEKYLALVASRLNQLHGTHYSTHYWRMVIGIWLRGLIDATYDRYVALQHAKANYSIEQTWITSPQPRYRTERPSYAFDDYNHYLMSRIIHLTNLFPYEIKQFPVAVASTVTPKRSRWRKIFGEIRRQLGKGLETFVRQASAVLAVEVYPKLAMQLSAKLIFVGSMYIPCGKQAKLQWSLGQIPYLYHGKKWREAPSPIDLTMRDALFIDQSDDPFELVLNHLIKDEMPRWYVEDYQRFHRFALQCGPKHPKVIITSFTIHYRECFEFWAAYWREKIGTRVLLSQHGGGYGVMKHGSIDNHFVRAFDGYYTWGAQYPSEAHVKPMPSFRLARALGRLQKQHYNPDGEILMLATTMPRYKVFAESGISGPLMLEYIEQQKQFFAAVDQSVFDKIVWRYFNDLWQEPKRLQECFPRLRCQHGRKKQLGKESDFLTQVAQSRLTIHTANETTYLETLAANHPTMVFWDPRFYEVRDEVAAAFQTLVEANILFYDPVAAAQHLNKIVADVAAWWSSEPVQQARKIFCEQAAYTKIDFIAPWREELARQIALASKQPQEGMQT